MESKEGRAMIGDADWATTLGSATTSSEIGAGEDKEGEFRHLSRRPRRKLIHDFLTLIQTQPLQTPKRLHRQHTDEGTDEESDVEDDSLPLVTGIGGGEGERGCRGRWQTPSNSRPQH